MLKHIFSQWQTWIALYILNGYFIGHLYWYRFVKEHNKDGYTRYYSVDSILKNFGRTRRKDAITNWWIHMVFNPFSLLHLILTLIKKSIFSLTEYRIRKEFSKDDLRLREKNELIKENKKLKSEIITLQKEIDTLHAQQELGGL